MNLSGFNLTTRLGQILFLFSFLALQAGQAEAAWHDKLLGRDTTVHYVHLTGHDGDNAANRKLLQIEYEACVDRQRVTGKQPTLMSLDDIPAVPRPKEVEIYYSANRTLLVVHGKRYQIEIEDCSLGVFTHQTLRLTSVIGRCDVDLIKKEARGQCDSNEHRQAGNFPQSRSEPMLPSEEDIRKMPPPMQKQVRDQIVLLKKRLDAAQNSASVTSNSRKRIAGLTCEVSTFAGAKTEKCIAHPESKFVIPASPLNAERPGILLDLKSDVMTLQAQKVLLHMGASERLFSLPPGTTVRTARKGAR